MMAHKIDLCNDHEIAIANATPILIPDDVAVDFADDSLLITPYLSYSRYDHPAQLGGNGFGFGGVGDGQLEVSMSLPFTDNFT